MTKTIDVSGLSKSYAGNKIIDRLSLTVASGEIYGLLGANGAGKSTTIECLLGTKQADAGTIRILGLDPYKDRQQLFEQVGVQFQEAHYPQQIKVKELCEETACLYQDAANYQTLLRQFALIEKANALVSDLSGGQRQKLFILLALLAKPKVLFLDELTTGLDPKARRDIWQSIRELKRHGLTIFCLLILWMKLKHFAIESASLKTEDYLLQELYQKPLHKVLMTISKNLIYGLLERR